MAKEKSSMNDTQQQAPDEEQTPMPEAQETEIQRNLRIAAALRREHSVNELEVLRNENRMLKQQLQALRAKQADA